MEGSLAAGQPRRSGLPFLVLALLAALVAGLLGLRGVGSHYVTADEAASIGLGRSIAHDPLSLFTVSTGRGLERAAPALAALAELAGLSGNSQVQLLRALNCLLQGLVAVPVFALARECGLSRWQALVPAAVGSAGALAFFGVFFLNTSAGVLVFVCLLWALIWALRRPGWKSDAVVVALVVALAFVRLGWVPLAACVVPAVVAWYWFARPAGQGLASFFRGLPRQLLRDRPLLTPLVLVAVVFLVLFGTSTLAGGYSGIAAKTIGWEQLTRNGPEIVSHLAISLAFVPFVLALSWMAANLFTPRRPADGAFSWVLVALVVVFGFVYMRWAAIAGTAIEDRYLAVLVPPVAVAGALAVFRSPRPRWWLVSIAASLTTWLGVVGYRVPRVGPFDFFIAPSSVFFEQVVMGRASTFVDLRGELLAAVVFGLGGLVAVLVALAASSPGRRIAVGFLWFALAGVLVFQLAAMEYPARKFTELLGMRNLSASDVEFVDRQAGGGKTVVLAPRGIVPAALAAQLPQVRSFNRSVVDEWPVGVGVNAGSGGRIDSLTGAISLSGPAPDLVLSSAGFAPFGLAGKQLGIPANYGYSHLVKPAIPLHLDWLLTGASADGYSVSGRRLKLRVFPRGRRDICVKGNVLSDPRLPGPVRFVLAGPKYRLSGSVQPGQPRPFRAPAPSSPSTLFTLESSVSKLPDGSRAGAGLFDISVGPCR